MTHAPRRRSGRIVGALVLLAAMAATAVGTATWWDRAADLRRPVGATEPAPGTAAVQRGAYLAQVGHCAGCHTARGGGAYAGGRLIETPFGGVMSANLTPHPEAGLGRWTPAAFRRALQQGRSADGRALLPACPYPHFSLVTDQDADDLFAYLRSLPAQAEPVAPHALRWPYDTAFALTAWRAVSFKPQRLPEPPPGARADWSRGAYLVGGLGHCGACHGQHDRWGATAGAFDLRGGEIPSQGWIAPALDQAAEAGVAGWTEDAVVALLRGVPAAGATVSGPMAMVVARSTQHYTEADLRAVAEFLRRLPPRPSAARPRAARPADAVLQQGARVYEQQCADCHGKAGQGVADAGPALQGNRALALASPTNVMRVVLGGGYGPATTAHPWPAGMPPFATALGDEDVAAVVTWMRWTWGGQASPVQTHEVNRQRGGLH